MNFFKDHQSFVPHLLDRGWEVTKLGHIKNSSKPRVTDKFGNPITFRSYSGSHFLERAVDEFNTKYAGTEFKASILVDGIPLNDYAGKIPYM